jgi:hypothetical protein
VAERLRDLATPGTRANRLLRFALLVPAVLAMVAGSAFIWVTQPVGLDLAIPLDATERWLAGGVVYDPASFTAESSTGLPFLYPPFVLPLLVPLTWLPRDPVVAAWIAGLILASGWSLRRLRVPWWAIPVFLVWAPFLEGWLAGNVQILLFAVFAWLFTRADAWAPAFSPTLDDPVDTDRSGAMTGIAAASIAALKVAQLHAWLYVLRWRPAAAVQGAVVVGAIVLATVPLTGVELWADWVEQLRRAAAPGWPDGGFALGRFAQPLGTIVVAVCLVLVLVIPRRDAGGTIGVLSVVGAASLRTYGILFMLPAMLLVRRELAIVAFGLIGLYTVPTMWAGILVVAAAWALSWRVAWLREPSPGDGGAVRVS